MITLITGTPGTGKTAYVVSELEKVTGRNIYVDGIPDLILPHEIAPPVQEWVSVNHDESGATSHEWKLPANSIIIIDEAQRSFRPRPTGSKVPEYVAALETHRHAGLDFWFITQHPGLLDVNIRRLCGRHIHVRNTPLGRRLHEATQVFDPENKYEREATVTRPFKLPSHVFGKYKSAEMHTKTGKRLPLSFYFMIAALIGFVAIAWFAYQSIKGKQAPKPDAVQSVEKQAHNAPQSSQQGPSGPVTDPAELLLEFVPRVPSRPETAPAFDALRQAKYMPVVVGCLQSASRCTCVNQQGLNAGLDDMQCRQWLKNPPFDPYREPPTVATTTGDKDQRGQQARPAGPAASDSPPQQAEGPKESA